MSDINFDDLISSLPLPAKVALLTGASGFTAAAEPGIGLRTVAMSDGPTGVRGLTFVSESPSTLLPNATLLAASWDLDIAAEVGEILAEEAISRGIQVVLGPTINLHRTPLGGRLFESFSEDPFLSGKLAAAYVTGMQRLHVAACPKHLVGNESETQRNTVNVLVDESTLREVYLLPFEIAVTDADAWSVMSAYNQLNGVSSTENARVQSGILKDEWGFSGVLISDWHAATTTVETVLSGLDLVMPGPDGPWGARLLEAVRVGKVPEDVIDEHVSRILRLAHRVGALGEPHPTRGELPTPTSAVRREQMVRLAASGITVLKNQHGALPLRPDTSIALIGRHALETIGMGGGSAIVTPPHQVSVAQGLAELVDPELLTIVDGVEVRTRPQAARNGFLSCGPDGQPGAEFRLYAGDGTLLDSRHTPDCTVMVGVDDDLLDRVARIEFTATIEASGAVELGGLGSGDWTLRAGEEVFRFALDTSLSGGIGEEILVPPATVLPVVVQQGTLLTGEVVLHPHSSENPNAGIGRFGLVGGFPAAPIAETLAKATLAASRADIAVVVVGLTDDEETESVDKHTLRLPGAQDELVSAVAASASLTIVVVNAATPILMPWLAEVDAVLFAGLPGQEAGRAIAATLAGVLEPAGRLVTSFPSADRAAPAWDVEPVDGELTYDEGTFVGYRGYFAKHAERPQFWMGEGLGYGNWSYAEPRRAGDSASENLRATITVTNTGSRTSREVVQLYGAPDTGGQPVRLVGWESATLGPGESAEVTVHVDPRMWRRWDTATGGWLRLPDEGKLLFARGLGDIRATLPL